MKKTSTLPLVVLTLLFAFSLISCVWGDSYGYETVGGTISQTSFITVFLVPALIAIGIFGAIALFAFVRIKSKRTV